MRPRYTPSDCRIQVGQMLRGALAVVVWLVPAAAYATCGEKGGPGYRGPDGRCVGWSAIGRVCGSPPTQRCTAERAQAEADAAAESGTKIQSLMGDAHGRAKRKGQ
jgi:hypothetical protein